MERLATTLSAHLAEAVALIRDEDIRNATIAFLNQSYDEMKELEKSGESASQVAESTQVMMRSDFLSLGQKVLAAVETDAGTRLKGTTADLRICVMNSIDKFHEVLPTLITKIRAERRAS